MGYNRAGTRRKARLKRRRKEERRLAPETEASATAAKPTKEKQPQAPTA